MGGGLAGCGQKTVSIFDYKIKTKIPNDKVVVVLIFDTKLF